MGGIFGKNKKPCLFPRVVYRARGRRAARGCCDAATWTGESYFYSARIGRAPRGSEPCTARLVIETSGSEFSGEEGDSAACPRVQPSDTSLLGAAGDTRGAELAQQPQAKPQPGEMKHQELPGEASGSQIPQESSQDEAAPHPPGSSLSLECHSGDQGVRPLGQTSVQVNVHVSAGDHEEHGRGQDAATPELFGGAEQGAGDTCVGKALWEVPLQKEGDSTAAWCPLEEPELALKAAEPGEAITDGQRAAQEQGREDTKAPPDLQLGQSEIAEIPEGVRGTAGEAEQDEEMAEACGDGQTAKEIPAHLPETQEEEEKEKIKISEEEPEEQLECAAAAPEPSEGLSAAQS